MGDTVSHIAVNKIYTKNIHRWKYTSCGMKYKTPDHAAVTAHREQSLLIALKKNY